MPKLMLHWPILCLPLVANTTAFIFNVGLIASTLFMAQLFVLLITRKIRFNFFSLLSFALLFGYGLGSFSALITAIETSNAKQNIFKFSLSLWLVISVSYLLAFFSRFAAQVDFTIKRNAWFCSLWTYTIMLILVLFAYISGNLNYGGTVVSEEGISRISILGSITYSLITIMPSLLTEEITANKNVKRKFLLKVLLIASLILILPLGRRPLVFAIIMTLLWSPQILLSLSKLRILLLTMSIGAGVVVSNYIFISLRLLSFQYSNASIIDRLLAVKHFLMSGGIKDVNEYLSEHNATRSLILNFFSDLVEGVLERPPLFGVETLESLKIAMPGFLGINKYQGNIENISQAHFGLRLIDEANSILTIGISDFGFLGVYIMPFLVMIIYQSYCMFILRNKLIPHFAKRILTFLLIYQVLNVETALQSYLVAVRDSLLIVIICSIFAIPFMILPRTSGHSTKS